MEIDRRYFIKLSIAGIIGCSNKGISNRDIEFDHIGEFNSNLINIVLVRKLGLSKSQFIRLLGENVGDYTAIFLFPEFTFERKFTYEDICRFMQQLPLNENTHVFCSAYWSGTGGLDGREESSMGMTFVNHGCYVSGDNFDSEGNRFNGFRCYEKQIITEFDSMNGFSKCPYVGKIYGGEFLPGIAYGDEDPSTKKVAFPKVDIGGKTLEFRLCADVECGTENNPDIVSVSAYNLDDVAKKAKNSIGNRLLIVNDSGQDWSLPIAYKDGQAYSRLSDLSEVCEREGVRVTCIR